MENNQKHRPDDLFREKLNNYEAPFEQGDWQDMLQLLEQDDALPAAPLVTENFDPAIENNPQTTQKKIKLTHHLKIILLMTTLSILSVYLFFTFGGSNNMNPVDEKSNFTGTSKAPANNEISVDASSKQSKHSDELSDHSPSLKVGRAEKITTPISAGSEETTQPSNPAQTQETTPSAPNESVNSEKPEIELPAKEDGKDSVPNPDKFMKTITRKYWVEDRYEYRFKKPVGDMEKFWWGIHYTQERPFDPGLRDSMGLRTLTHGFNTQFMSGNIIKNSNWALYGGLDWGMQFYGRSEESIVTLNVANEDKAFTRLNNSSMDFLGRLHFEYAKFQVVPYVNLSSGPRILMTGQQVRAMLNSTEYEGNNSHNVSADATMLGGWGLGARVKISPRVSFDARYEQFYGTETDVVDLKNSSFNGATYTLSKNRIKPDGAQLKFGLIFDLSSEEEEKILVEPGHYKTLEEAIFTDPQDSNRVFIPCPCIPCDKKEIIIDSRGEGESGETGTIYKNTYPRGWQGGSGSGSSGGKSSFPGIKTPPPAKH
jgi:hypothetical protein